MQTCDTKTTDLEADTTASPPWTAPTTVAVPMVRPIDQSTLALPPAAAVRSAGTPVATPLSYLDPPTSPAHRRKPKRRKRGGGGFLVLLMLGALVAAGVVYGPDLYDEYVAEQPPPETAAPLAFPTTVTSQTAQSVRTATFELDGLPSGSEATYTITIDFETWVSRVVIDRPDDTPDLEVLTFSDDALVRRLDADDWFQLDRGSFPFDEQLRRTDWIRSVDEVFPRELRSGIEITAATESEVGGVATRRLTMDVDPRLATTPAVAMDPVGDISAAVEAPASDTEVAPPSPPAPTVPATADTTVDEPITVEVWIDGDGMIRKSVGGELLGLRGATILDTAPTPWVPDYPEVSQVRPMTAAALIELGL